jgi:hypothetical protein
MHTHTCICADCGPCAEKTNCWEVQNCRGNEAAAAVGVPTIAVIGVWVWVWVWVCEAAAAVGVPGTTRIQFWVWEIWGWVWVSEFAAQIIWCMSSLILIFFTMEVCECPESESVWFWLLVQEHLPVFVDVFIRSCIYTRISWIWVSIILAPGTTRYSSCVCVRFYT